MEKTLIMLQWQRRSALLTQEEEAIIGERHIIVVFCKHTLDDALQATISHLTRSSLHRCLQR
jgi:hypothetical protein